VRAVAVPLAEHRIALQPNYPIEVHVVEPRRRGAVGRAREGWRYRYLIPYFGRRFLQKRYQRTWLGWIWLPLRPSLTIGTRALVFGGLIGVAVGKTPYILFFLIASSAWQLFAETAFWATRSLELNRGLLRKMYIPRLTPLAAAVIPSLVEFLIYVGMILFVVCWYLIRARVFYLELGARTILTPLGLLLSVVLGVGVGLWTSTLGAQARDVRFLLNYVLSFVYFLTPVIYPLSAIPHEYRPFAELNPMTGAIEMVKDGVLGTHSLTPDAAAVSIVATAVIWAFGLWYFARMEGAAFDNV
jgi:lipopolysaccharide transport system permease protein